MRPRRLFKSSNGKFFYLIGKRRKYVKVPEGMSQKQVSKINIANIINLERPRRLRRKRRASKLKYERNIVKKNDMQPVLPLYHFVPRASIPEQPIQNQAPNPSSGANGIKQGAPVSLSDATKIFDNYIKKQSIKYVPNFVPYTESAVNDNEKAKIEFKANKDKKKPEKSKDEKEADMRDKYKKKESERNEKRKEENKKKYEEGKEENNRESKDDDDFDDNFRMDKYKPKPMPGTSGFSDPGDIKFSKKEGNINSMKFGGKVPEFESGDAQPLFPRPKNKDVEPAEIYSNIGSYFTKHNNVPSQKKYENEFGEIPRGEFKLMQQRFKMERRKVPEEEKSMEKPGYRDLKHDSEPFTRKGLLPPIEHKSPGVSQALKGEGSGLYNDELSTISKYKIKKFVPVIAADQVSELSNYIHRGMKSFGAIINTNPSTSDGSGSDGFRPGHWQSLWFDNRDDYPSVEFFDPLVENVPSQELIGVMKKIATKMNPGKMFKYKQNQLQRQSKKTSDCGYHSLHFLEERNKGVPFSEATGYSDWLTRHAPDDSKDGEKDIRKTIKEYNKFI